MSDDEQKGKSAAGLAVLFGLLTGFVSLALALVTIYTGSSLVGTGVCLAAAALAFGLIANAALRN